MSDILMFVRVIDIAPTEEGNEMPAKQNIARSDFAQKLRRSSPLALNVRGIDYVPMRLSFEKHVIFAAGAYASYIEDTFFAYVEQIANGPAYYSSSHAYTFDVLEQVRCTGGASSAAAPSVERNDRFDRALAATLAESLRTEIAERLPNARVVEADAAYPHIVSIVL